MAFLLFGLIVTVNVFDGLSISTFVSYVAFVGALVPAFPPFSSYPIVYVFAIHEATTVIFPVAVLSSVTSVFPLNHPSNVYPVFVGVHNVPQIL